jgi:hypothetical protein
MQPTAGVGHGHGVGGVSKYANMVIASHMPGFISHVVLIAEVCERYGCTLCVHATFSM